MSKSGSDILPGSPELLHRQKVRVKQFFRTAWPAVLVSCVIAVIALGVLLGVKSPDKKASPINCNNPETLAEVENFRKSLQQPPNTSVESLVIEPPSGEVDKIIFFIHGLGGYIDENVPNTLAPFFPTARWVLPQAPKRPVYLDKNESYPSWYNIRSYAELNSHLDFPNYDANYYGNLSTDASSHGNRATIPGKFFVNDKWDTSTPYWEDDDGLIESARALNEVVHCYVGDGDGLIRHDRWIIMGFSQGAVMSQLVGLTSPKPPAGIGVLSGYFPMRQHPERLSADQSIPLLLCHGKGDPILKYSLAVYSSLMLQRILGFTNIIFAPIRGMKHQYGYGDELGIVTAWMTDILQPSKG